MKSAQSISELKSKTGIIILAAGSSSRMGTSKQLLKINGEYLLRQTVVTAQITGIANTVVVLGANAEIHQSIIQNLQVDIVINAHWQTGMGSSLKAGLAYLKNKIRDLRGVIVLVCDQPLLTHSHLIDIINKHFQSKKKIIASKYDNTEGVPAFFSAELFPAMESLADSQGAKKIIEQNRDALATVLFSGGEIDLDTPDDYSQFLKGNPEK
jgi:molybdenum cofactor cytidylyltransferase